jgi:hypothetical protein
MGYLKAKVRLCLVVNRCFYVASDCVYLDEKYEYILTFYHDVCTIVGIFHV